MGEGPKKTSWPWRTCGRTLRIAAALAVIALIIAFGERQMKGKIAIVKPLQFIGHADDAAYAEMGVSLAEGRGLQVDYISTFFIPYPPGITHREDHWPPFMGFSIAPCVWLWGKAAWIAKLPAIFYASIGLPLTTALLAYALSRRAYVALAAALLMLNPFIYEESLRTLSDVATAMLVAGFLGSIILARRFKWMHLAAGAFAAAAYFAKGSELGLYALYPLIALLACGPSVFKRGFFYAGFATALLLAAPFWYSSWKLYNNPLHSTQNYVSAFYGFEDWEQNMYAIYWGHDLPKPSDRWLKHGGIDKPTSLYLRESRLQMDEIAREVLTGGAGTDEVWPDFGHWGDFPRKLLLGPIWKNYEAAHEGEAGEKKMRPLKDWVSPEWELAGAGAWGLFWVLVAGLPVVCGVEIGRWFYARRKRITAKRKKIPWLVGPVLAVTVVILFHWIFLAYMWDVAPRFCLPILPLMAALGATAWSRLFEWPLWGLGLAVRGITAWLRGRAPRWMANTFTILSYWHVLATLLLAAWIYLHFDSLNRQATTYLLSRVNDGAMGFMDQPRFVNTGRWIKKNLPSAIVMCRNPWELQYYLGPDNRSICLPYPKDDGHFGADEILAIAHYYGVTHFLMDDVRAPLEPYIDGSRPGFRRIPNAPDNLYEIDWSKITPKSVEDAIAAAKRAGAG